MAEFTMLGQREDGFRSFATESNIVWMNPKRTKKLFMARAEVEISIDGKVVRTYTSQRDTIEAPDGALILPYFREGSSWFVVMVEQFRIALPGKTIESPGGEVDRAAIKQSMARELEEETRITVDSARIDLVFKELFNPSMMASKSYGGIVEIQLSEVPEQLLAGEWHLGEYTVVLVRPLVELLRQRDAMETELALYTSRLLDEVAKKVGLLSKSY